MNLKTAVFAVANLIIANYDQPKTMESNKEKSTGLFCRR